MNRLFLSGRITKVIPSTITVKKTGKPMAVSNFVIRVKDESTNVKKYIDFWATALGKQAEFVNTYLVDQNAWANVEGYLVLNKFTDKTTKKEQTRLAIKVDTVTTTFNIIQKSNTAQQAPKVETTEQPVFDVNELLTDDLDSDEEITL